MLTINVSVSCDYALCVCVVFKIVSLILWVHIKVYGVEKLYCSSKVILDSNRIWRKGQSFYHINLI